jgi:hypothetical protein
VPGPARRDVHTQVLNQHRLAVTGLAVERASLPVTQEPLDQPFLGVAELEIAEQREPPLAVGQNGLRIERVVCGRTNHAGVSGWMNCNAGQSSSISIASSGVTRPTFKAMPTVDVASTEPSPH